MSVAPAIAVNGPAGAVCVEVLVLCNKTDMVGAKTPARMHDHQVAQPGGGGGDMQLTDLDVGSKFPPSSFPSWSDQYSFALLLSLVFRSGEHE